MKRLIFLLKFAHAVEIGAYNAYEGHWRTLPFTSKEGKKIREIQLEEQHHREQLDEILKSFGTKSNVVMDSILFLIGRSVSIGCYVMGYRAAMWGAKILELMGADVYKEIIREAKKLKFDDIILTAEGMQWAEEEHEAFFKSCLKGK